MQMIQMFVISFFATLILWMLPRGIHRVTSRFAIPVEIRKTSKIESEVKRYSSASGLVATPDFVVHYRDKRYVGEYKTRVFNQCYVSDVIQMSVAKVILEDQRQSVSSTGLLKIETGTGIHWHRVALYSREEVLALKQKYSQLKRERVQGDRCQINKICQRCEYRDVC